MFFIEYFAIIYRFIANSINKCSILLKREFFVM